MAESIEEHTTEIGVTSSVFRGGGHAAMAPPSESPKTFFDKIHC